MGAYCGETLEPAYPGVQRGETEAEKREGSLRKPVWESVGPCYLCQLPPLSSPVPTTSLPAVAPGVREYWGACGSPGSPAWEGDNDGDDDDSSSYRGSGHNPSSAIQNPNQKSFSRLWREGTGRR